MFKKIILLSILSTTILGICSEGCLRCDLQNNRCQFCDIKRGFKTVRGECMKVFSENCAIFNFEGFCIHCEKGFFLDTFAMKCVPVPEIGLVQNCESYSADNICYKCAQDYHLTLHNTCIQITTQIENCSVYRTDQLCEKCNTGYLLSFDFKTCEQPTQISNCSSYSKIQCQQCKSGYQKNLNNYLMQLYGFKNARNLRHLELKYILQSQEMLLPAYGTCQKLNIDNCSVYATPNECVKCQTNFYLQQNKCIPYPQERILNCQRYKSLKQCVQCDEGMYLKSETECVLNDKVPDCITYDSSAVQTTCVQCASTHFLSEFNVCSARTNASDIANCLQLDDKSETCVKCVESFTLTNDNKKCLESVLNCQQHEESDVSSVKLTCRQCNEGFYFDQESQTCKEGTISKCVQYSRLSNSCEVCENRYYLAGGLCRTHEDLVYCDNYNQIKKNSCSVCNDKTVLFFRLNTCLPVQYINKCKIYESQTACQQCEDGYQLDNVKKCIQIPGSEFCLQKQNGQCVKCLESYVLENGKCEKPLAHIMRNCASYNLNGLLNYKQLTCNYCKENSIPMNYKESYVCIEKQYLENQLKFNPEEKCLKYKQDDNGVYNCVSCVKEYLLLNGKCIQGPFCSPQYTLRLQVIQQLDVNSDGQFDSFYVEKVNECGPKINNCKVAAPDLIQDQTNVRYSCVTCDDNMISVVEQSNKKVLMKPPRFKGDDMFSPLNFASSKICKDPSKEKVIGRIDNNNCIVGCELYKDLTGFGLGCQKCEHGKHGRVYNVIHNCLKYSSLTSCTQCKDNFYPAQSYLCKRVEPVMHCVKYDSSDSNTKGECKQCTKDFYVKDKKCVQRDQKVNWCEEYESESQKCKTCKQDYFLKDNQCHKKIHKCKEYENSTTCKTCEDSYYLKDNLCYQGQVQYCKIYDQTPGKINKCKICQNKYFLVNNECKQFAADISDCDVYSQEHGFCNKCNANFLLFEKKKQCTAVVTVNNCKEYKTRESCRVCDDGYYPVNYGLRCLTIPTDRKCQIWGPLTDGVNYDKHNCLKCNSGYLLINKQCRLWFQAIKENCLTPVETITGTQKFYQCKYCKDNTEPVNIDQQGMCLEEEILKSFPSVQPIDKCVRYSMQNAELKCLECAQDFYLQGQTKCITLDQCKALAGYYPTKKVVDTSLSAKVKIVQGASCINDSNKFTDVTNCLYQPVIAGTQFLTNTGKFKYGCVECFKGYSPLLSLTNTTKRMAYSYSSTDVNATITVYDDCIKLAGQTVQGTTNSNNEIENCQVYASHGAANGYHCLSCKQNYRGNVLPGKDPADANTITSTYSYIDKCVAFNGCSSNNLTTQSMMPSVQQFLNAAYLNTFDLQLLYSGCNKCNSTTQVLAAFVIVNTDASTTYTKIRGVGSINTNNNGATTKESNPANANGHSYGCYTVDTNANTMTVGSTTDFPYIANCQKMLFNAGSLLKTGVTFGTSTTFDVACVQCKPGFKPLRSLDSDATHVGQEIIKQCDAIQNCDANTTQVMPNACTKCSDSYVYKYNTTSNEVQLDTCILTDKTNCYSASATACVLCKVGYLLNSTNGNCEQQIPPKCTAYNPYTTDLDNKFVRFALQVNRNAAGCVKCDSGYIPMQYANNYLQTIKLEEVKKVCVAQTNITTLNTVIANCDGNNHKLNLRSEYNGGNALRTDCTQCSTGYIPTEDGKCIIASNNANCELAESAVNNYCVKCATNYQSIAGVCQDKSVIDVNCAEFADTSFRTGALCKKCADNYYLVKESINNVVTTNCVQYQGTEIKNCAQFDSTDPSRLFCVKCKANFALLILKGDELNGKQGYNRICQDVSQNVQTNCAEFSIEAQSNGQFICNKCNTNYVLQDMVGNYNTCVNTINNVANCEMIDINDQLEQVHQGVMFKNNYFPRLSTLKCKYCKPDYFLQTNTNSCAQRQRTNQANYNNKCKQFEQLDDYCKICEENYFLSSDKTSCIPAPNIVSSQGSIFSCNEMNKCNDSIIRNGLDSHVDALLSCHQCKSSKEIPFIAVQGKMPYEKVQGLVGYNIVQGQNKFTDLVGGKSNFCAEPKPESFNIDNTNNDKFAFPTNCAVGMLNVDTGNTLDASNASTKTNVDLTKIQVFCAACKPGHQFVPALDTNNKVVPYMAGECKPITNCKYSTAFNYCTECKKDYAFEYVNGKVKYDSCVQVQSNKNCYAQDTANSKCKFCCKGTYLGKDGLCESIKPPKCQFNEYIPKQIYSFNDLNTGLYLSAQGTGCNKCMEGFFGLYKPQNHWICTESQAHYDNLLGNQTEYINNCVNYFVENEALKCKKCKEGFVPIRQDGRCTAVNTGLQNCLYALNDVHCEICSDDYVLVNRTCAKKNIDKCYKYTYNIESHQQVCVDCEAGYYLEANTCLPGNVNNCLLYETKQVCNKCNVGFHLVKRNDGVSYCYPIDQKLNCAKFDSNEFQKGRLQCTECSNNQFVISNDYNLYYSTHCLKFFETPNCVKYDIKPAIADSSFSCLECTDNFFLKDLICQVRTVEPMYCVEHMKNDDRCSKCKDGYFVSDDGTKCLPYPIGTPNCRLYSNANTCQSCANNFYLQNGLCVDLAEDVRVDNCLYYVGPNLCDQCVEGFLNVDGQCQKIQAQNCAEVESLIACASCPKGFGFVEENSVKSCVQQSVQNCVDINPNPPYKCLECENKFYVDGEGACIAIKEEITNCLVYSEEGKCKKCESFTALSQDKSKCLINRVVVEQIDQNCQESLIQENYQCRACQDGFVFIDEECQQCELEDQENCLTCNPLKLNECLICKSGFFMNSDGECVEFVPPKPEIDIILNPPQEPTDQTDDKESSTLRLSIFTVMMTLLNLLF